MMDMAGQHPSRFSNQEKLALPRLSYMIEGGALTLCVKSMPGLNSPEIGQVTLLVNVDRIEKSGSSQLYRSIKRLQYL